MKYFWVSFFSIFVTTYSSSQGVLKLEDSGKFELCNVYDPSIGCSYFEYILHTSPALFVFLPAIIVTLLFFFAIEIGDEKRSKFLLGSILGFVVALITFQVWLVIFSHRPLFW